MRWNRLSCASRLPIRVAHLDGGRPPILPLDDGELGATHRLLSAYHGGPRPSVLQLAQARPAAAPEFVSGISPSDPMP